jgi:hypothetical protein
MVAVGLLGSAIGTIYWICTRPCGCCGQRKPDPNGYSFAARCVPATLVVLLGLVCGYVLCFVMCNLCGLMRDQIDVLDRLRR